MLPGTPGSRSAQRIACPLGGPETYQGRRHTRLPVPAWQVPAHMSVPGAGATAAAGSAAACLWSPACPLYRPGSKESGQEAACS